MYLTEDEARQKWCPFFRVTPKSSEPFALSNRGNPTKRDVDAVCCASDCMAWRFGDPKFVPSEKPFVAVEYEPGKFRKDFADNVRVERGYCGLAGNAVAAS